MTAPPLIPSIIAVPIVRAPQRIETSGRETSALRLAPRAKTTRSSPMPLLAGVASASLVACPVLAQTQDASATSAGHLVVGLATARLPAYQGADDHRTLILPVIDFSAGDYFVNVQDGVGVRLVSRPGWSASVSLAPTAGYRKRDVPEGIGRLDVGVGARAFTSVKIGGALATLGATKGIARGNRGLVLDGGLALPVQTSPKLLLIPAVGATWADARYNDRYFGVSARQAAASGLARYAPGQGLKDASVSLLANYSVTDRVSVSVLGSVTWLLSVASDSPLTVRATQSSAMTSVTYRF